MLDPDDLYQDIIADPAIMGNVPAAAQTLVKAVWQQLSVHITNQIKRGEIDDVVVDGDGNQDNTSNVQ